MANVNASPMSDGARESLLKRLVEARAEVERWERHAKAARARRRILMVKLAWAGVTTRVIGKAAGMSSSGVSQAVRAWEHENRNEAALTEGGW